MSKPGRISRQAPLIIVGRHDVNDSEDVMERESAESPVFLSRTFTEGDIVGRMINVLGG